MSHWHWQSIDGGFPPFCKPGYPSFSFFTALEVGSRGGGRQGIDSSQHQTTVPIGWQKKGGGM